MKMELTWDTNMAIGVIGATASIIGLLVAVVQSIRYRAAKENYKKLKQIKNTQIWGSIALTLEAYDTLNEAKQIVEASDIDRVLSMKIVSARKSVVAQYLRLLEQAVLDEEEFTEATALEWKEKGLLENEWRYGIALKLAQKKGSSSE